MGFIGVQPATVPLTSSDITDGIISTAKIANDAVDNTKLDLTDNYAFTGTISGAGSNIIEVISSVCDGSTVGSYTFQNVSASQEFTTSFVDVTGSSIAYTPPTGTTQVAYEFGFHAGFQDNHAIASLKFFIDSDEVVYARHTYGAIDNFHARVHYKWIINIGGSADTNVGRLASWTSAKTLKLQGRDYGSSNDSRIHSTMYWENTGTGQFSMPTLTITAMK
tara:strand:- start:75 stop:737 length:663 start_codon:yes stop_codon:yes gene_type:complete